MKTGNRKGGKEGRERGEENGGDGWCEKRKESKIMLKRKRK